MTKPRKDHLISEKVTHHSPPKPKAQAPDSTTVKCPECGAKVKLSEGVCFSCGDLLPAKTKGIKREPKK